MTVSAPSRANVRAAGHHDDARQGLARAVGRLTVRALTELAATAYPSCPPYGGAHPDPAPHLTIGHLGGPAELPAAAEAVCPLLPITAEAIEVTLMAGPEPGSPPGQPGRWATVASFPLGEQATDSFR